VTAVFADDFFRLAHDDTTGRPRVNVHALGLGLAAGLLGELLYASRIGVHDGQVYVAHYAPPSDVVGHALLDQIAGEPHRHTIRTWLSFLAEEAFDQVAGRLLRAGHVRAETSGFLWARTVTYVPADMKTAAWPTVRLAMALRRQAPMDEGDLFLAGLAVAAGLDEYLIRDADHQGDARRYLHRLLGTVWPPARELLSHTHAVVGNALVSHRT
jgi:hypothetical protein